MSFNPRTREGCDQDCWELFIQNNVSIHAPVKGATIQSPFVVYKPVFQSTHP